MHGIGSLLGHLFYPWGIILQVLAIVHLIRRGGAFYWFWIIFIGGGLGALAYIAIEVLPDATLLRDAFQRVGRKSRIQQVELLLLDNPSPANYEELAELHWDQKEYAKAREAFDRAIAARSDSIHDFYRRAQCAMALEDYSGAVPDLELVVSQNRKFDSYRAIALLANAYAMTGNSEGAEAFFLEALPFSTTIETMYQYARFLKSQNRTAEAREWVVKLQEKKRTMPRYVERRERPWFKKARTLLKELG